MIEYEFLKKIDDKLSENYFAKKNNAAYEKAIEIIQSINDRFELKQYLNEYLKVDLDIWNLLAAAYRMLLRTEPITLKVDEDVFVPTKVYKEGKELAKILEINEQDYMITVRPYRDRAEIFRLSIDMVSKQVNEEKSKLNIQNIDMQLSIFEFI